MSILALCIVKCWRKSCMNPLKAGFMCIFEDKALEYLITKNVISVPFLQHKLKISHKQAERIFHKLVPPIKDLNGKETIKYYRPTKKLWKNNIDYIVN